MLKNLKNFKFFEKLGIKKKKFQKGMKFFNNTWSFNKQFRQINEFSYKCFHCLLPNLGKLAGIPGLLMPPPSLIFFSWAARRVHRVCGDDRGNLAAAVAFLEGMEGKEEDLEKITPMTFEENCIMTLDSAKWASHIAKVS